MAAWPELAVLKQARGVTSSDKDALLTDALDAAIEQVQLDVGEPVDEPSVSLRQAALLLAVTVTKAPDAPFGVASTFDTGGIYVARNNPNYLKLLHGKRVRFGVA
jgi:hypothetical protein